MKMRVTFQLILSMLLILVSFSYLQAKEWRGITPLHSTKTDVDRILGKPLYSIESSAVYSLADDEVEIDFSTKSDFRDCVKELPAQTVLRIMVVPKTEIKLSDFTIDEKTYKKIDSPIRAMPGMSISPFRIGNIGYINNEDGVVVRGYQGNVLAVFYFAAASDRNICEGYYDYPEELGTVLFDFIDSSPILGNSASNLDIQSEVDKCIIHINISPISNCVVVNSGTDKEVAKRIAQIIKAIKYRKFDVRRFKFLRGENRSPIKTKIDELPIGLEP